MTKKDVMRTISPRRQSVRAARTVPKSPTFEPAKIAETELRAGLKFRPLSVVLEWARVRVSNALKGKSCACRVLSLQVVSTL